MERYFYLSLFVTIFCINAMENTKKGLVELDTHQREQFARRQDPQKGKIYEGCVKSLAQAQQKAKELKKNCLPEYEVYKRYYRSCPNRGEIYPVCPGQKWEKCPTCYSIFEGLHTSTQQYILQKKEILKKKWHLHLMYSEKIKLSDYYYDIENPQNDVLNFTLWHHDLKPEEEKLLQENLPKIKEKFVANRMANLTEEQIAFHKEYERVLASPEHAKHLVEKQIALYKSFEIAAQKEKELWSKNPELARSQEMARRTMYKTALERLERGEVVWGFL